MVPGLEVEVQPQAPLCLSEHDHCRNSGGTGGPAGGCWACKHTGLHCSQCCFVPNLIAGYVWMCLIMQMALLSVSPSPHQLPWKVFVLSAFANVVSVQKAESQDSSRAV